MLLLGNLYVYLYSILFSIIKISLKTTCTCLKVYDYLIFLKHCRSIFIKVENRLFTSLLYSGKCKRDFQNVSLMLPKVEILPEVYCHLCICNNNFLWVIHNFIIKGGKYSVQQKIIRNVQFKLSPLFSISYLTCN